jgi:MinD-like ATPase involved in chromosome partitioning or flagellar assembly
VLSVSALKGGVGKTTIALGLASAAMAKGLRTLVIDLDPQCNASNCLGAVGEFEHSAAEVLKKPRHNSVLKAIVASSWAKGQTGRLDIMAGNPRLSLLNLARPSFKSLWNLEQALAKIEADYDLVLIDTPPSMNGLTRMAWVASDRVLLVTEPSINSLLGVENAIKAFNELRRSVNRQVSLFGIVVNRLRPSVAEHQYRVNELEETYPSLVLTPAFEEKSAIQQSTGAGRSIHSWPGQSAAKLAIAFDSLLEQAQESFASEDMRRLEATRKSVSRNRHSKRTHETLPNKPKARRAKSSESEAFIQQIETLGIEPVSEEYQEQWNDILRQTMTPKQLKAFQNQQKKSN